MNVVFYDSESGQPLEGSAEAIVEQISRLVTIEKPFHLFVVEYNHGYSCASLGYCLYIRKECPRAACCPSMRFPHHPTFYQFFQPETFARYRQLGRNNTQKALEMYGARFLQEPHLANWQPGEHGISF